jgi:zinc transport system substrate-binding protein
MALTRGAYDAQNYRDEKRGFFFMRRTTIILCALLMSVVVLSCSKRDKTPEAETPRLRVVTSLYPVYDFAKNIGRERVELSLLLPPGVEPHSFEPKPADIVNLNKADIFIYTNKYMEPWVGDIIKGIDNNKAMLLDSSRGIVFMEEEDKGHDHKKGVTHKDSHGQEGMDPHIWLDLDNAIKMVDTIRDAFIQKDQTGRDYYQKNADAYKSVLKELDIKFQNGLSRCKQKVFITGGHFAFGYLARRYGLTYISAYGFSPDAEPTPGQLAKITRLLKQQGLKYIFHEELLMPRVADTLAKETGAQLLFLHGAHNISREEFERGTSFVKLMEKNLENLEKGLECR